MLNEVQIFIIQKCLEEGMSIIDIAKTLRTNRKKVLWVKRQMKKGGIK